MTLFVARLAGSQAEMGAQHGRMFAADASRLRAFYKTMPERALGGDLGAVGRGVIRAIATAWQARLVRERPPELAARARAFAEAAGEPQASELTYATMDSLQNCVSLAARMKLGPFAVPLATRITASAIPACSTAVAWGSATRDGELLFARNFDFPGVGVWDASPAFVTCNPDHGQAYGFFTTRGADTPVVTVVNEAGLVLAPHTRWHRGVRFGGAMIVDLVHDIARRAESLADAIAIARERPPSSSWGIAIGSARERSAIVLELAGKMLDVVRPSGAFLVCANRYRSSALQAGQVAGSHAWAIQSERRERKLRQLVESHLPLDAETLARCMGDRHDIEAPARRRRLGGILAQPTNVHCAVVMPVARRALVGIDRAPVCEGQWAELAWDWRGETGAWELTGPGFDARVRDDIAAPHDEATRHVQTAARAFESAHDVPAARAAIERAVGADPDDPSLRLAALWLALESGANDRAMLHAHAGLARETDAYRRGQLLLWGARAARAIDPPQAKRWADELARLSGEGVDELQAAARRRWRGRPHVNLMMADAY